MNPRYSRYYTFVKPLAKNKYVKTYSSLAFSLIAVMIFAVFAIKPTVSTILVLQKNIQDQEGIVDQLNQKAQNLSQGKDNLAKIDQDTISKMNALLPSKTDITSISDGISAIALANNASISAIQFQPTNLSGEPSNLSKAPTIQEASFTINIGGEYQNLITTLNSLESSLRLVRVDSVTVSQTSDNQIVMSISGRSFFLQN